MGPLRDLSIGTAQDPDRGSISPYPLARLGGVEDARGGLSPPHPEIHPDPGGSAGRVRSWREIRTEWPALDGESAASRTAPLGRYRSTSAAVQAQEGAARMARRRDRDQVAGIPSGRRPRHRGAALAARRELAQLHREQRDQVVADGRRAGASAWARVRGRWAADAGPAAWDLLEPIGFARSVAGIDGALELELLLQPARLAVLLGSGQIGALERRASEALDGRPVRIFLRPTRVI
jgi:hypothetical protein